jgi:hypothetical protein
MAADFIFGFGHSDFEFRILDFYPHHPGFNRWGSAGNMPGMKRRLCYSVLCVALLGMSVGCMSEKRVYQVSVRNDLAEPITVWLVKEYGLVEAGWESPEDVAVENPITDDRMPAITVPPGKTASRGPIEGRFDKFKGRAYLRVYLGTPTLTEMLAMGKDSLSRLDLLLQPGANAYVVNEQVGRIAGTRVAPTTQPDVPPTQP